MTASADLRVILGAKERGLPVTCDVNPLVLALHPEDFREGRRVPMAQGIASYEEVAALWEALPAIDCFSAGPVGDSTVAVSVLLSLVNEGRLTMDDVVAKMHDAPKRILHLPSQPVCCVLSACSHTKNLLFFVLPAR